MYETHRHFENVDRFGRFFGCWFAFCAVLGLGLLGLTVWAVVRVVLHFT